MELRDAGEAFCAGIKRIAGNLRQQGLTTLADGLLQVECIQPRVERREDELYLAFCAEAAMATQKTEVSSAVGDQMPYGVEIVHTGAGAVTGVSLYLL